MQRQTTLEIPLGTCNLVSVETAGDADLDSLAAEAERGVHALAHGAAETDALLKLEGDVLGNQLSVKLRLDDLAAGALLDVGLELVDLSTLAADDDARTRGADDETQLVARTLDFNRADAGGLQLLAKLSLQLDVLDQQLVIAALDEPA